MSERKTITIALTEYEADTLTGLTCDVLQQRSLLFNVTLREMKGHQRPALLRVHRRLMDAIRDNEETPF